MFLSSRQHILVTIAVCIIVLGNLITTLNITITEEMGISLLVSGSIALFLGVAAYTINQSHGA